MCMDMVSLEEIDDGEEIPHLQMGLMMCLLDFNVKSIADSATSCNTCPEQS